MMQASIGEILGLEPLGMVDLVCNPLLRLASIIYLCESYTCLFIYPLFQLVDFWLVDFFWLTWGWEHTF